jgi:predicted aspartyl protease
MDGGVWNVMAQIGPAPLEMSVDSGCADTSIPELVAQALVDGGEAHWTGEREYNTANGKVTNKTLVINRIAVGEHTFTNVEASVSTSSLLGWSVFNQAGGKVTIDSRNQRLIFG